MRRIQFIILLLFALPGLLVAQKIDSMMNVYGEQYPQEKMYVQFDKNVYTPGETIWFKAYLFSGTDPSLLSKNFYAELSDDKGVVVQRRSAPIRESTSYGSFDIPVAFKGNHYHFRAYTAWMMNFDTAFLFEKDIRIINVSPGTGLQAPSNTAFLQFFPEGGNLIAGLENNVAFKATDQYGIPIPVKGVVKDASGKELFEFNSIHDGMGKFLLVPEKTDVFTAYWKDTSGIEHKTDLPQVQPDGVALRALNASKKVLFSVSRNLTNTTDFNKLFLIAHMNQHMVYKATINLQDLAMSSGAIPVDQLPSGILQLTLFNSRYQPLAERVLFINNHEFVFSSAIDVQTKTLTKRGLNTLDISVPDTLKANLSLVVTDFESDGKKKEDDNIISSLLLTSEIRGRVYNPYYYFSNDSDSTKQHLDLVMLTHGWRRFKWEQLAQGKTPLIKYHDQDYLAIRAEVLGIDPSRISSSEGLNVILKQKDSSTQMLDIPRISGGKFGAAGLIFYDTAKAYYQFNVNRKMSNEAAIIFNNGLYNGYKQVKPLILSNNEWSAEDSALLRKNHYVMEESAKIREFLDKKVQTLESVTVRGRPKTAAQKLDEKYASGMFVGGDAIVLDLMDDPISAAYQDILVYVATKAGGLQVGTDETGQTYLIWRGSRTDIFLDEMKVTGTQLRAVPITNVAMVKVFRPGTMSVLGGGMGGTVAIYTKKGGDKSPDPSFKGLDQARIIGYSPVKQFYSPDYLQRTDLDNVADIRTTLYWNPLILTDKSNRKVSITFYNNDFSKKLRVVLEGVNADGKLTRVEKILQ